MFLDPSILQLCRKSRAAFVSTMSRYTQRFLDKGSVYRIQADGLGCVYQVELGILLWNSPSSLEIFRQNAQQFPWLETLGPREPWLVERPICVHESSNTSEMGTAANVHMLEECV